MAPSWSGIDSEELDEIGAGHIEKGRRLHGRQLGILRDEGDAAARW
jgi:hypothetical protein